VAKEGLGYDVLSFDEADDAQRFLEVKTTGLGTGRCGRFAVWSPCSSWLASKRLSQDDFSPAHASSASTKYSSVSHSGHSV
jgi:hypothetical protein